MAILVNIDVPDLGAGITFYTQAFGLTVKRRLGEQGADLDSAVSRAADAGVRIEQAVRTAAWGKIAVLADPFGHGLCLIQFLNRGYDELAGPLPWSTGRRRTRRTGS